MSKEIKDKILKIKISRLGGEYIKLYNIIKNCKSVRSNKRRNSIFFVKDNIPLMEYNKKGNYLWCNHEYMWDILYHKFYEVKDVRHIIGVIVYYTHDIKVSENKISIASRIIINKWKELLNIW